MFGKLNDVTMTSSPISFLINSNTNLPWAYLKDIPNFISIGHKRAELQSKELTENHKEKILRHCDHDP